MLCYIQVENNWDYPVSMCCVLRVNLIFSPQWAAWTHLTLHLCQLFSVLGVDSIGEQGVQGDAHLFLTVLFILDLVIKQRTVRGTKCLVVYSLRNELWMLQQKRNYKKRTHKYLHKSHWGRQRCAQLVKQPTTAPAAVVVPHWASPSAAWQTECP